MVQRDREVEQIMSEVVRRMDAEVKIGGGAKGDEEIDKCNREI